MAEKSECFEIVNSTEVRQNISSYIDAAWKKGERIAITKHGNLAAAIVPYADLCALELADDTTADEWDRERGREKSGAQTVLNESKAEELDGAVSGDVAENPAHAQNVAHEIVADILPYIVGKIEARLADAEISIGKKIDEAIKNIVERTFIEPATESRIMKAALVSMSPSAQSHSGRVLVESVAPLGNYVFVPNADEGVRKGLLRHASSGVYQLVNNNHKMKRPFARAKKAAAANRAFSINQLKDL